MTTITIESGPKNARTDPETGLRRYFWQGLPLLSVTSVRRVAGVPHRLVSWQQARVVERATLGHADLTAMLSRERRPRERTLEANRIAEASRWLRAAATEERDRSSALGTVVHNAAAAGMLPEDVPDVMTFIKDGEPVEVPGADVRPRLAQYRDWLAVSGAEVLAAEFQVFNLALGYAGSIDLVCRFPGGRVFLVDIKTGGGVYSDHALQVEAYARAEFVGRDDVIDERLTALLCAIEGTAILHIAEDGWEFLALKEREESWTAFRGLLVFSLWTDAHEDPVTFTAGSRKSHEREMVDARIAAAARDIREVV